MSDSNPQHQKPLQILVFSASLRNGSLNTRLANLAAQAITKNGGKVDFANMSEFDCLLSTRTWRQMVNIPQAPKNYVNGSYQMMHLLFHLQSTMALCPAI